MDKNAITLGLRIGRILAGQRRRKRTYLYNGIQLPALPYRDKEKYPYALIHSYTVTGSYRVCFFAPGAFYFWDDSGRLWFGGNNDTPVKCLQYDGDLEQGWYAFESRDNQNVLISHKFIWNLVWADFDVEYEGVSYMEATEPIPVYEQ